MPVGQFTGAHLNPAVTVGFWVAGVINGSDVPKYLIGEFLGAFIGASLVLAAYWDHFKETEDPGLKLAVFSTGPAIRNYPLNVVTEIIGTFVLVFGVLAMAVANKPGVGFIAGGGGLIVGLLVLAIGLSLGGPTGYAINPARDLGPRIAHAILPVPGKGPSDWGYAWVPGGRAAHRRRSGRGHVLLVVRALGGRNEEAHQLPRGRRPGCAARHGGRPRRPAEDLL